MKSLIHGVEENCEVASDNYDQISIEQEPNATA